MKRLIVNADDYGLTPGVSAGIRESHQRGIVTSTTVMMNMPGAGEAVRVAGEEVPALGLGVHLVLTAGRPVLPPERVTGLLRPDGSFWKLPDFKERLAQFDGNEVRAEWRAQIESLLALDVPPDHLDSHHHTAYMTEALVGVLLDLASEYRLPIRNPTDEPGQTRLAASGVCAPQRFVSSFYGPDATLDTLNEVIETLPDGVTELMCHPGHADAELRAISSYHDCREKELAVLTDPALKATLASERIELATFQTVGEVI